MAVIGLRRGPAHIDLNIQRFELPTCLASVRVSRRATVLRKPALAAAVMLRIAIAFAPGRRNAQIKFLDIFVVRQFGGRPIHYDAAVLEYVSVVSVT